MPIAVLTSKGQMPLPKEVRKALNLQPSEKVIAVVEGNQAILKPREVTYWILAAPSTFREKRNRLNFVR